MIGCDIQILIDWLNFTKQYNIENENGTKNKLKYSPDNGVIWKNIIIPKGIWGFTQINKRCKNR